MRAPLALAAWLAFVLISAWVAFYLAFAIAYVLAIVVSYATREGAQYAYFVGMLTVFALWLWSVLWCAARLNRWARKDAFSNNMTA